MLNKKQEIELKIDSLNSEGMGVARIEEGFVVFCKDALPGDVVTAEIRKVKKNYAEAVTKVVLEKSPFRVTPKCKHFGVCGGCKIQNFSYEKQLEFKTDTVKNAFEKIGGFKDLEIPSALKSDNDYYYRNKMEFSFSDEKWLTTVDEGKEKEKFAVGLHIPKFHTKIFYIEECFLQTDFTSKILNHARKFFKERNLSIYSTNTHEGYLRFLILRECRRTKDFLVNLITFEYNEEVIKDYSSSVKIVFSAGYNFSEFFHAKKGTGGFCRGCKSTPEKPSPRPGPDHRSRPPGRPGARAPCR